MERNNVSTHNARDLFAMQSAPHMDWHSPRTMSAIYTIEAAEAEQILLEDRKQACLPHILRIIIICVHACMYVSVCVCVKPKRSIYVYLTVYQRLRICIGVPKRQYKYSYNELVSNSKSAPGAVSRWTTKALLEYS